MKKLQTSIEFMVILAAVAGFSVFVVSLYANLNHTQNSAYQSITSYSSRTPNSIVSNSIFIDNSTSLYASVPKIIYLNQTGTLSAVYSYSGQYQPLSISVKVNGPATVIPGIYTNLSSPGLGTEQFSVVPNGAGQINLTISMHFSEGNGIVVKNATVYAYSEIAPGSGYNFSTYSAVISRRVEQVQYRESQQANVVEIGHYGPFIGSVIPVVEPVSIECKGHAWGTLIQSGQYIYYLCFSKQQTSFAIANFNTSVPGTFGFNITLKVQGAGKSYTANLTSDGEATAPLYSGSTIVGYAMVNGVSGSRYVSPPPDYSYLWNSGSSRIISNKTIADYFSALPPAFAALGRYNNIFIAGMDDPAYSGYQLYPVTTPVGNLNANASSVIDAAPVQSYGCAVDSTHGITLNCPSESIFYYNVTVQINGTEVYNTTVEYQGSLIHIR